MKLKPIEHRVPTAATIRQLYGTAFRCGKPGCGKPLYRMDNETGAAFLNSYVSHICARSEGGPRWNPEMSEGDNRSASNLMPMCFEHAREIDDAPENYPVALLRKWKQAQIDEHVKMQKSWPLTDAEAQQVIDASFSPTDYGTAITAASSVTAASREVGRLVETARQQRRLPLEAASAWRAMRIHVQRSMPHAWDSVTGELLAPFEPSRTETAPFQDKLEAALEEVMATLRPLVATLVAELHAVRAVAPHLGRWCDWVEEVSGKVLASSGRWPGRPPEDDDGVLVDAIAELTRASRQLSAAWQGQPAEEPPEPTPAAPEPAENDVQRTAREHQELLERARPWARVDTRPFDANLYRALIKAARFAVDLPELPMYLFIGLTATTGLAADVARNADDMTMAALIDDAAEQHPLAIAVLLLCELTRTAKETQRSNLARRAGERAVRRLRDADWANRTTWIDNKFQARRLLGLTALTANDDEVRERITTAITERPELLEWILIGISQQSEEHHGGGLIRIDIHVEDLPSWFPTSIIAAEIRRQHPNLAAVNHRNNARTSEDQTLRLAANILSIDSRYE